MVRASSNQVGQEARPRDVAQRKRRVALSTMERAQDILKMDYKNEELYARISLLRATAAPSEH